MADIICMGGPEANRKTVGWWGTKRGQCAECDFSGWVSSESLCKTCHMDHVAEAENTDGDGI